LTLFSNKNPCQVELGLFRVSETGLTRLWCYHHSYLGCSATTGAERAFKWLLQHLKNKQANEQLRIRLESGGIWPLWREIQASL